MSKGGGFENEVARILSLWWTDGKRDDIFGRSDGSGGRFTARKKKGKDTANMGGDLTFTDSIGEPLIKIWNIEAKTGYSGKKKVTDADGDIVKIPIYTPAKKGEKKKKDEERTIIGWKDKIALSPWDILDYVDSRQSKTVLEKMWEQCSRDAELTHRRPILIFRRNGRQPCICFKRSYYLLLREASEPCTFSFIQVFALSETLYIMSLKNFFDWVAPETILFIK